ncbi:DNL zinc finger-domain-containing protein [Bisporella sp. PMI_857]|nr:DNL zinc finger-domain-containing protein [Bisporella sp. PMI_857]
MPPTSTPFLALRSLSRLSVKPPRPLRCLTIRQGIPRQCFPPAFSIRSFSSAFRHLQDEPTNDSPSVSAKPLVDYPDHGEESERPAKPEPPSYQISLTCDPCGTRSTHRITKQGYHYGSVLITCPECRNRHVISDHLNMFGQTGQTVEDFMKDKGQLVKKGTLSEDGDVEFWEDKPVVTGGPDDPLNKPKTPGHTKPDKPPAQF